MVDRYGDWVLLRPPVKTSTYFLWASPFFVVLVILLVVMGRRRSAVVPEPLSNDEAARLEKLLGNDK
jgi:cytochrome c-type biogenesis protein CcmH